MYDSYNWFEFVSIAGEMGGGGGSGGGGGGVTVAFSDLELT